jgi:hypothetical protein
MRGETTASSLIVKCRSLIGGNRHEAVVRELITKVGFSIAA